MPISPEQRKQLARELSESNGRAALNKPSKPLTPEQIKAQELIARLGRRQPREARMTWPGGTLPIILRVPTVHETQIAKARASAAVNERMKDASAISIHEATGFEEVVQILAIAVIDPDTCGPLFPSANQLALAATEGEITALFAELGDLRERTEPDLDEADESLVAAFLEAVKKKDETSSKTIASDMPRASLLSLVGRLSSSMLQSSSITPASAQSETDGSSAIARSEGEEGDSA